MPRKLARNIVTRWEGNPLLTPRDLPFAANDLHNAGAVRHNGTYVLLVTVEEMDGTCAVYKATGTDGKRFTFDPNPALTPASNGPFAAYEEDGVRDARITPFEDFYFVTYLAESAYGFRIGLARTDDFTTLERVALISEPDTKSGVIFPRKIGGRFARLERPREGGGIWVSYSDDLLHWGGWDVVMTSRGGYWDHDRVGAAVPPIETEYGWLLFYYGIKSTQSGPLFRLGAAILHPDDPTHVCGRTDMPALAPRERYERIGDVGNLIFSCGAILSDDGSQVDIYYGAADSCICLGTVALKELVALCTPCG